MGCGGSAVNHRLAWYEIRPTIPVAPTEESQRTELFGKMDAEKTGSVGVKGMEKVCATYSLGDVSAKAMTLLSESFAAAAGGEPTISSAKMAPLMACVRDTFDLFVIVKPQTNDVEKLVTKSDVTALQSQMAILSYPWRVLPDSWSKVDGTGKGVPFVRFVKWALSEHISFVRTGQAPSPPNPPRYPLTDSAEDKYLRDVLLAQIDAEQSGKVTLARTIAGCMRYLGVRQYPNGEAAIPGAFDKTAIGDRSDSKREEKYLCEKNFRSFLGELQDALGGKAPQTSTVPAAAAANGVGYAAPEEWMKLEGLYFPYQRTDEQLKLRDALYIQFDQNHSGRLSLAETQAGCSRVYKDTPQIVTNAAIRRAFVVSSAADERGDNDESTLERSEFRVFIANLHDYCQLRMFMDSVNIARGGQLKLAEMNSIGPFWQYHREDAAARNADISALANGRDQVDFEVVAAWWMRRRRAKEAQKKSIERTVGGTSVMSPSPKYTENVEVWKRLQRCLPRRKTPEETAERDELFKKFDSNGSGRINDAEAQIGVNKYLEMGKMIEAGELKRAVSSAFNAAAGATGGAGSSTVERVEFRLFLCYLYDYCSLFIMFDEYDGPGRGQVTLPIFRQMAPKLESNGLRIGDPEVTFRGIDKDGSGSLSIDEFVRWCVDNGFDADGARKSRKPTG